MPEIFNVKKISENIICCQASGALVNSYIVTNNLYSTVIDTLLKPRDSKHLKEVVASLNKPVRYVINTHWHSDHCYGNRFIAEDNTHIIAHEDFFETISAERPVISPNRKNIFEKKNLRFPHITFSDALNLYTPENFRIFHLPGHTLDSCAIIMPEEKIMFSGDTLLDSGTKDIYALPYFFWGDSDLLLFSLEKTALIDINFILPGHGNPIRPDKIQSDLKYVSFIKKAFEQISQATKFGTVDELLQELLKQIPINLVTDILKTEKLWVPRVHELNLKKLIAEAIEIGKIKL